MFSKLIAMVALFSYDAAADKITPPASVEVNQAASVVLNGLVGTIKFRNNIGNIHLPYGDSVSGPKNLPMAFCRTSPVGDADYAGLAIGAIMLQTEITSQAVSALNILIKDGAGASDWSKVLTARSSTAGTARTAAKNEIDIRGTNSGTGDYRAVYGRIELTAVADGSGDALRGYALAKGGVVALRGAHLTAEIAAAGSVSGIAAGATLQATTVTGLTLSAGTIACADLVSDLSSTVANMTSAAFIRVSDNQSNKMPFFLDITASATGVVAGTTAATAAGALKIRHNGATRYIQLFSSVS